MKIPAVHFLQIDDAGGAVCFNWIGDRTPMWCLTDDPDLVTCEDCQRFISYQNDVDENPGVTHTMTVTPENLKFVAYVGSYDIKALKKALDKAKKNDRDIEAIVAQPRRPRRMQYGQPPNRMTYRD